MAHELEESELLTKIYKEHVTNLNFTSSIAILVDLMYPRVYLL